MMKKILDLDAEVDENKERGIKNEEQMIKNKQKVEENAQRLKEQEQDEKKEEKKDDENIVAKKALLKAGLIQPEHVSKKVAQAVKEEKAKKAEKGILGKLF